MSNGEQTASDKIRDKMLGTIISEYVRPHVAWHDRQNDDSQHRGPGAHPDQHHNLCHRALLSSGQITKPCPGLLAFLIESRETHCCWSIGQLLARRQAHMGYRKQKLGTPVEYPYVSSTCCRPYRLFWVPKEPVSHAGQLSAQ